MNQTSESVTASQASSDFDDFCKTEKDFSSKFSGKSQAFQASFSYAGFGVGGGSSGSSSSGSTDETFRQICRTKKAEFTSQFSRSFAARDGTYVATAYTNCVRLITESGSPLLWGTVKRTKQNDPHYCEAKSLWRRQDEEKMCWFLLPSRICEFLYQLILLPETIVGLPQI